MQELLEKLYDFWANELETKKMVMPSKITDLALKLQTTPEKIERLLLEIPSGNIGKCWGFIEPSCDLLEQLSNALVFVVRRCYG